MTVDFKKLRVSLKGKLDERKHLKTENSYLRVTADQERDKNKKIGSVLMSQAGRQATSCMVDQLADVIYRKAVEAAQFAVDQNPENGDAVMHIHVDSFTFQYRMSNKLTAPISNIDETSTYSEIDLEITNNPLANTCLRR